MYVKSSTACASKRIRRRGLCLGLADGHKSLVTHDETTVGVAWAAVDSRRARPKLRGATG
eukprot:1384433-Pyramimonas_sp.AAC.1